MLFPVCFTTGLDFPVWWDVSKTCCMRLRFPWPWKYFTGRVSWTVESQKPTKTQYTLFLLLHVKYENLNILQHFLFWKKVKIYFYWWWLLFLNENQGLIVPSVNNDKDITRMLHCGHLWSWKFYQCDGLSHLISNCILKLKLCLPYRIVHVFSPS